MRIHSDNHFIQLYPTWREHLSRLGLISADANKFIAAEPLLSSGEAMETILGELENGRDVFVGDTHTEMSHHLFYAIAVKLAKSRGIEFVSIFMSSFAVSFGSTISIFTISGGGYFLLNISERLTTASALA